MTELHPVAVLNRFYDKELYRLIYFFVEHKGDGPLQWPDWCFVPLSGVYAALQPQGKIDPRRASLIGIHGALATWRMSKGIYRFDPEILNDLWDTDLDETIDESVLYHLPEFCCYIETPGKEYFEHPLYGFWVHMEWDVPGKRPELRLLYDIDPVPMPFPIHLGFGSLVEGIKRSLAQGALYSPGNEQIPSFATGLLFEHLSGIISLVLYLCTANADISGREGTPTRYKVQHTRRGPRVFGADHPRTWDVAVRLGAALRSARARYESNPESAGTGSPKRPHIRRAHFHTYHIGAGRVDSILKWLPPIAVNVEGIDDIPAVVRDIQ